MYAGKFMKAKAKIDKHFRQNFSNESKINSSTALSTGLEKIKNVCYFHVTLLKLTIDQFDGKMRKLIGIL